MRTAGVPQGLQRRVLTEAISGNRNHSSIPLTLRLWAVHVDTGTANEHIVDDSEDAFTAHPFAMLILDAAII